MGAGAAQAAVTGIAGAGAGLEPLHGGGGGGSGGVAGASGAEGEVSPYSQVYGVGSAGAPGSGDAAAQERRRKSWGESGEVVDLQLKRLLSFFTTYVPESASEEGVLAAWEAEGPGAWDGRQSPDGFCPPRPPLFGGALLLTLTQLTKKKTPRTHTALRNRHLGQAGGAAPGQDCGLQAHARQQPRGQPGQRQGSATPCCHCRAVS